MAIRVVSINFLPWDGKLKPWQIDGALCLSPKTSNLTIIGAYKRVCVLFSKRSDIGREGSGFEMADLINLSATFMSMQLNRSGFTLLFELKGHFRALFVHVY